MVQRRPPAPRGRGSREFKLEAVKLVVERA
jgi:hypothetical protein